MFIYIWQFWQGIYHRYLSAKFFRLSEVLEKMLFWKAYQMSQKKKKKEKKKKKKIVLACQKKSNEKSYKSTKAVPALKKGRRKIV